MRARNLLIVAMWLLCLQVMARARAVRVALLERPGVNRMGPNATELASIQLMQDTSITLLDRNLIYRLLRGKAVSAALGSVSSELKLGKLASADVMAIVNRSQQGFAQSLIVFDVDTGVRLVDRKLTQGDPKVAANEIVTAVREAVGKRAAPIGRRRTIGLMSVRNADLPQDAVVFCNDVGKHLLRRLTRARNVVVLERDQLKQIIAERRLPTTAPAKNDLLTSVIVVDLQLSRSPLGDITATAILSNSAGKPIALPSATVHGRQTDPLADELATAVMKAINDKLPEPGGEREREAERFHREAVLNLEHSDWTAALRASEAAYALAPHAPGIGAALARARIESGILKIFNISGAVEDPQIWPNTNPTPAEIDASLKQTLAGCELLAEAVDDSSAYVDRTTSVRLLRYYLAMLGAQQYAIPKFTGLPPLHLSPAQVTAFNNVRKSFRRYRMDTQQPAAMAEVHNRADFNQYTLFVFELLGDSQYCFSTTLAEWTADVNHVIPSWMKLAEKYYTRPPREMLWRRRIAPLGYPSDDWTNRLLGSLSEQWLSGYGSWGRVEFDNEKRPMARQQFTDGELTQLNKVFVALATDPEAAFHQASEEGQSWIARKRWTRTPAGDTKPKRIYPVHLMGAIPSVAAPADRHDNEPETAPGIFWKDSRTLIDVLHASSGIQRIFDPVVVGSNVYVVAMKEGDGEPTAQLLKFNVDGGQPVVVSEHSDKLYSEFAMPDVIPPEHRLTMGWPGTSGHVNQGVYVFVCWGQRIVVFPLKGGPARCITPVTLGHPKSSVQAAAVMNDTLYVALGAPNKSAFLLSMNLKSGVVDTLASSMRKEHLSPFDDTAPFYTSRLMPDVPRNRIVFMATSRQWKLGRMGFWAFDVKGHSFHQLLRAGGLNYSCIGPMRDPFNSKKWAVACGGWMMYDPATDKKTVFHQLNIQLNAQYSESITPWDGDFAAVLGDWIIKPMRSPADKWKPAWGRMNLHTGKTQLFPWVRPLVLPIGSWPLYLSKVDDHRFLVGDESGLWVLTPPDETSSTEPPKPVDTTPPPLACGGQLPWSSGKTLYDLAQEGGGGGGDLDFMVEPRVKGNYVYAIGLGHTGGAVHGQRYMRLIRFSTTSGTRMDMGTIPVQGNWSLDMAPAKKLDIIFNEISATAIDDQEFYVQTSNHLFEFPLNGNPARELHLSQGHWWQGGGICAMGKILYVVVGTGAQRIESFNPKTGKVTPLDAAPRDAGIAGLTPSSHEMKIDLLAGDAPRHRILYLAFESGVGSTNDGLWSYDVLTHKRNLLLPLFLRYSFTRESWPGCSVRLKWSGTSEDGTLLIDTSRGLFAFDPRTDKARVVQQNFAGIDVLADTGRLPVTQPTTNNPLLAGSFLEFQPPFALSKKWLWGGNAFGRVSLDGTTWQELQSPRANDNELQQAWLQLCDHGHRLLVADRAGCWLLNLK